MKPFTLADIQRLISSIVLDQPTGDSFLDARYQAGPRRYYRLFYHLARRLQPELVVELGGWQGTAAAHFAAGNPNGIVVTIDHHSDPGDEVHQAKMREASGQYKNLIYLKGWTWDMVDYVRDFKQGISLLFIDSWHHYEYAKKDWDLYSPLLSNPALVICDDITTDRGPVIKDMDVFWEELPGQKFLATGLHNESSHNLPIGFLKFHRTEQQEVAKK